MHHRMPVEDKTKRLKKIVGQLNGIIRMAEEDRNCTEILIQISSVRAGLARLSVLITEDHIEHCMTSSLKKNQVEESIMSLSGALKQMLQ